jgi:hypothetical protein
VKLRKYRIVLRNAIPDGATIIETAKKELGKNVKITSWKIENDFTFRYVGGDGLAHRHIYVTVRYKELA